MPLLPIGFLPSAPRLPTLLFLISQLFYSPVLLLLPFSLPLVLPTQLISRLPLIPLPPVSPTAHLGPQFAPRPPPQPRSLPWPHSAVQSWFTYQAKPILGSRSPALAAPHPLHRLLGAARTFSRCCWFRPGPSLNVSHQSVTWGFNWVGPAAPGDPTAGWRISRPTPRRNQHRQRMFVGKERGEDGRGEVIGSHRETEQT